MKRDGGQANMRKKKEWKSYLKVQYEKWSSKFGNCTHLYFDINFERLLKINFGQDIYYFDAQRIRNPMPQTMHGLELKRRNYNQFEIA